MSDRIDPRRQTREIREALSRFEPEQLLEILTHVFRQYVVEGGAPPPMQLQDELAGLSFAQVIERLQLRLDLPELRLFELQAGRVMVRLDGRLHPLETADSRQEPLPMQRVVSVQPMSAPLPPAPAPPAASPGSESREIVVAPSVHAVGPAGAARTQPAAAPTRPQAATPAARPASARPAASPTAAPTATPAPTAPAKAQPEKPESPGGRFGLLEID